LLVKKKKPAKKQSTSDGRAYDPRDSQQQAAIAWAVNSGAVPPGGYRAS
jgi:hypothetical protein